MFAFSGQMSLRIYAELLKNAPVLLKHYWPFWPMLPIDSGFKRYLSRETFSWLMSDKGFDCDLTRGCGVINLAQMKILSIRPTQSHSQRTCKLQGNENNLVKNLRTFEWGYISPYNQGRNDVIWRLGQEAILTPPCSNLRSFGTKCIVLKKILVTLLGRFLTGSFSAAEYNF